MKGIFLLGARLSFDPEHDATDCGGTCVNEDCGIEAGNH